MLYLNFATKVSPEKKFNIAWKEDQNQFWYRHIILLLVLLTRGATIDELHMDIDKEINSSIKLWVRNSSQKDLEIAVG